MKRYLVLSVVVVTAAGVLSALWEVPYLYTLIGFSGWAFIGHLVTADDDLPGGWSNPDGALPFPWLELVLKGLVLVALCVVAAFAPAARQLGGTP